MSHPTWVRGLKLSIFPNTRTRHKVAPYVGAWIETEFDAIGYELTPVAPYVGAWIETRVGTFFVPTLVSRTLRGCVD